MQSDRAASEAARQPLILASGSPYRRELLGRLGLPFSVVSPDIDERPRAHESAPDLVCRLAAAKAAAVAAQHRCGLIIGSDQVAALGAQICGKPGHRAAAIAQLTAASGRTLVFYTGLAVHDCASGTCVVERVATEVRFRALTEAQIEAYVSAEPAFDCAGSFKAEGLGISLFESIHSPDPTALTGLPLVTLVTLLARFGVSVPAPSTQAGGRQ